MMKRYGVSYCPSRYYILNNLGIFGYGISYLEEKIPKEKKEKAVRDMIDVAEEVIDYFSKLGICESCLYIGRHNVSIYSPSLLFKDSTGRYLPFRNVEYVPYRVEIGYIIPSGSNYLPISPYKIFTKKTFKRESFLPLKITFKSIYRDLGERVNTTLDTEILPPQYYNAKSIIYYKSDPTPLKTYLDFMRDNWIDFNTKIKNIIKI